MMMMMVGNSGFEVTGPEWFYVTGVCSPLSTPLWESISAPEAKPSVHRVTARL